MPGIAVKPVTVTFSFSYLSTFLDCPRKARYQLEGRPSASADYHVIGTAVHLLAENRLAGMGYDSAYKISHDWLVEQIENGTFEWVKTKTPTTLMRHHKAACESWEEFVNPQLSPVDDMHLQIEHTFDMPLGIAADGTELRLKSQWDYLDRVLGLLDWKNAGREYVVIEKQRWALQPTAYTLGQAWLEHGDAVWDLPADTRYPFTFVVNIKGNHVRAPQWVECMRGPADWLHLVRVAHAAYEAQRTDTWSLNDQSFLCSQKFCEVWDECKGSTSVPVLLPSVTPAQ